MARVAVATVSGIEALTTSVPEAAPSKTEMRRIKNREACRRWRAKYPDRNRAAHKKYHALHPDARKLHMEKKKKDPAYKAKRIAYTKAYEERNPGDVRRRRFRTRIRALLAVSAELECSYCREADVRVLAINHKVGTGRRDKFQGGLMYHALSSGRRGTSDLEVVCHNCNIRYEFLKGTRAMPDDFAEIILAEKARRMATAAA